MEKIMFLSELDIFKASSKIIQGNIYIYIYTCFGEDSEAQ